MREQFPENTKFNSIEDIANFFDNPQTGLGKEWSLVEQVARWSQVDEAKLQSIRASWLGKGQPRFSEWAPYANYCSRVLFVYFIAVTAALVPTGKSDKSLIDVMYFMYLPFCHAFVSGDKFHRDLFPVYKRPGQEFVWGSDLKQDLGVIA